MPADTLRVLKKTPKMQRPSHAELLAARDKVPAGTPEHASLANEEHRAFAREWTKENPLVAVPSLLAGIPMYAAAKKLGMTKSRSPGGLGQMAAAYRGVWEGLSE